MRGGGSLVKRGGILRCKKSRRQKIGLSGASGEVPRGGLAKRGGNSYTSLGIYKNPHGLSEKRRIFAHTTTIFVMSTLSVE